MCPPAKRRRARIASFVLCVAVSLAVSSGIAHADRRWTGLGDGTSWSAAANWEGNAVPGVADDIRLDHAFVAGAYTVQLPGGSATTSLHRLSIVPGNAVAITLVLPATNIGNPGLKAGDNLAGTDDIILGTGAVLVNASSASFGNGIEANSVANGSVRIENGGRYLHSTQRATSGIVQLLSTAPGTELGVFEFDVPSTNNYTISAAGRTYGSLTLTRSAGAASYTALGSTEFRVRGNLRINPGVSLASSMTGTFRLGGNFSNDGTQAALPSNQATIFDGPGVQILSGGSGLTINGNATIQPGTTLAVDNRQFFANGVLNINGRLRVDVDVTPGGVGTFVYGSGTGELELNSPTLPLSVTALNQRCWPAIAGPSVVYVRGAGLSLELARTVSQLLSISAPVSGAQLLTVTGTLERNAGATLNASPAYGPASTLRYASGASPGVEWIAGGTVGAGVPHDVVVDCGTGSVILPASGRIVPGSLSILSGTLWYDSDTGMLSVRGDANLQGGLWTFGRPLTLDGTGLQLLSGADALASVPLRIAKSAGSVRLASDVKIHSGLLFDGGAGDVLDLDGHELSLDGAVGGTHSGGVLRGSAQSSLEIGPGGVATPIAFTSGGAMLHRLTVDGPPEIAAFTLGADLTVLDSLVLVSGRVATDLHVLTLAVNGVIEQTAGWVHGQLAEGVPAGNGATLLFAVGDSLAYAPATLVFATVTASGMLTLSTTHGDHPQLASGSNIDPGHSVNRVWHLASSGFGFTTYFTHLEFNAADVDDNSDPLHFGIARYTGSGWVGTTPGGRTMTSAEANGLDGLGDLAIGAVPTYTLSATSNGNGTVAVTPLLTSYTWGEIVRLNAAAFPGYQLGQWGGDATGNDNPLDLVMDGNKSIQATFAINQYAVDLAIVGHGTVSRSLDQPLYDHGTPLALTGAADPHWHFQNWTGSLTSASNPLNLTVTSALSLTATFKLDTFAVTVTPTAGGTVTRVPYRAFYAYGDTTVLTAKPVTGYAFVSWGGGASGSANPLTITIDTTKVITAAFAINGYSLVTSVTGNGSLIRSPDLATYNHGTPVTLTATAGSQYHFVGYSGDTTTTTNPLSFIMTGSRSVTATFAIDTRALTTLVVGSGSVLREPDLAAYPIGSSVQLTAVPNPGQAFAGWTGDTTAFTNPSTLVMNTNRSVTATFEANTPKYWTGLGDGVSWGDGLNWIRNTPPVLADEVILDNSMLGTDFLVQLPAGSSPVLVHRLSIRPAASHTITLKLPATNTANPGLAVGDSLAGTDDIIVGSGGVLINASGASAGNGIQTATVGNGGVRIEDGGRYVHASLRSASGVVPVLSTATGTEQGICEYDVPGTANWNVSLSGRTYGSLVLTRTAGAATYGALGSSASRIRGALRINSNVTFAPSLTGTLELRGDVVSNGAPLMLPAAVPLLVSGSSLQTLSGSSSIQFAGATTIAAGATLALSSSAFTNSGTLVINGVLRLLDGAVPAGAGTYVYDATTGTLEIAAQNAPYSIDTGNYWPVSSSPALVRVMAAGATIKIAHSVAHTLSVLAPLTGAGLLSIDGTLEMAAGGAVSGAPVYQSGSILRYIAPQTTGPEWTTAGGVGAGAPYHVDIALAAAEVLHLTAVEHSVFGNLTLSGGTCQLNALGGHLVLNGNLSGAGSMDTNDRSFLLRGVATQTLSTANPLTLDYLRIEKAGGQVLAQTDMTLVGAGGDALDFNGSGGDFLSFDGHTLTLKGAVGGSDATGAIRGNNNSSLVLAGSNNMGILKLAASSQTLASLRINIAGASPLITLGSPLTVINSLLLDQGVLATGANVLTVFSGATVTRASGYVNGKLARQVNAGANVPANFDVGDGGYAPVTLLFHAVTTPGTVQVTTTAGDHPNLASVALDSLHSVNRYWTLSTSAVVFDSTTATFGFSAADVDPGSDPLGFEVRRYSGGWTRPIPGLRTATSTAVTGLTSLGDFAVARPLVYSLNVSSTAGGSVAKVPNQSAYDAGTAVTVTATNQPGYHFTGWTQSVTGTTNPLNFVMNSDLTLTANFQVNGPKQWVGATAGGDGVTWPNPLNWTDGATPIASEEVILDNTFVTGTYSLALPAGTTTLLRLTISPSVGRTITLNLPATNTANPGLLVGDGSGLSDDIVLGSGAVLKNSSGAAAGSGIAFNTSSNSVFRINGGGRYVHNTARSASALTALLSAAAGTETGEFEYDVPGTANYAIDASGATYGALTLTRSAGAATYTAAGAGALTVRGTLKTNAGITLASTMSGALNLAGDLTVNGAALTIPATQVVNFNANGVQVVSGAVSITLAGNSTVAAGATAAIAAASFLNNGTLTINGALQLNQSGVPAGTGTYSYSAATGTLIFNNTSGTVAVSSTSPFWPASNSPTNVTVQGGGGISLGSVVARTIPGVLRIGAPLSRAGVLTCTGTVQMNSGGSISISAPKYSGTPTLVYAASLSVGIEWSSGTFVGIGVPQHVSIANGTVNMPNSDRDVLGNLTISNGAALVCSASLGNLNLHGNLTCDGGLTPNGRTVQFTGSTLQTVGGTTEMGLDFVSINKAGGSVQLLNDLAITGTSATSLTFNGSTGDILNLNGRSLTVAGAIGGTDPTAKFSGTTSSVLVLNGDAAIGSIQFSAGAQSLKHLTFGGAAPTLTLASPLTLSGMLSLGAAKLTNATNTLSIAAGGAATRTTGFVLGNLSKSLASGSGVTANFEVGTGTAYTPVAVSFGSITAAGTLTVSTTATEHPQIATSSIDATRSLNRYWTLTNGGLVFNQYSGTFTFVPADLDATTDPLIFLARRFSASAWNAATMGTRNSTSTQVTGATAFGDYAFGAQAQFTVNLSTLGNGTVAKNPGTATYTYGQVVAVTATPNSGQAFVSWSGDTTTLTNPLSIVVTRNRSLTANFTYTMTTAVVGGGSVAKSPNLTAYTPGTVVSLTATPTTGYNFSAWSGDTVAAGNPISLAMTSNRSVTATFALKTYTITLANVGNGTAAKSPDQATYTHGSPVTLTATPAGGNSFVSWSGDTATATTPLNIVVTKNRTLTANFTWALNTAVSGGGSVARNPNLAAYNPGTSVTLTPTPSVGWNFTGWTGDTTTANASLVFVMNKNRSYTANFALNTYTVTLTDVGNGTSARNPAQANYTYGSTVVLTAVPIAGNAFVSWSGDTATTTNPLSIVVTKNRALTANYTYSLTTALSGNGSIGVAPSQSAFNAGTPVTLTATAGVGSTFSGWTGDTTTATNPLALVMTRNRSLTANFTLQTYTVTLAALGNGAAAKAPVQANYTYGSTVTLTGTPNAGNAFVAWSGDTATSTNPLSLVVTRNRSLTANFTFALVTAVAGNGSVAVSPNQTAFVAGSAATLTATPATGYSFTGWTGDTTAATNPLNLVITRNRSLTANFAINSYTLSVNISGSGAVLQSPNQPSYTHGTSVTLTATPQPGFNFAGWSGDTAAVTNPLSIVMTRNRSLTATFAINQYTVVGSVAGSGAVALSPNLANYNYGFTVSLSATPDAGWHFTGWTGDTTTVTNPLSMVVTRNRALTGNFAIDTHTLTVTTVGSGSVARNPNLANYNYGTVVALTVTPAPGWSFTGWTGDVVSAANSVNVTLDANRSVTATFTIDTHVLNLTTVGSGAIAKSPDLAAYDYGTVVTLTATPPAGWHFGGYTGDLVTGTNPATVTMNADRAVSGTFVQDNYALAVTIVGSGTVARSPDLASYPSGTLVALTATPLAAYHFVGWSGDLVSASNPVSITMNAARAVTATFALDTHALAVAIVGSGAVSRSPNLANVPQGTVMTLTATPQTGWSFAGWSGDTTTATNPLVLTVVSDLNFTATFTLNSYTLSSAVSGNGGIDISPNLASYPHGTSVTLTATPDAGWQFAGWTGDTTAVAPGLALVMTRNRSLAANFTVLTYTLAVTSSGSGGVVRTPSQANYAAFTPVTLTATATGGNNFLGWSGDTTANSPSLSLTMTRNRTLTATFTYSLTLAVVGSGSVSRVPSAWVYAPGTIVALTPTPSAGYHFTGWSGDTTSAANPLSVAMWRNRSMTATFVIDTHTLGVTAVGSGSVARSPSQASYNYGAIVTLTAAPSTGWSFVSWSGSASGTSNPTTVTMTVDRAVTATFAIGVHLLDVSIVGSGTVTRNPAGNAFDYGTVVKLTATPSAGWRFDGWSGDLSGVASPDSVVMTVDHSVGALFAIDEYALNVTVTGKGAVLASPDQPSYATGTVVHLSAQPSAGWTFMGWGGDATGAANPIDVTVSREMLAVAVFADRTAPVAQVLSPNGGQSLTVGDTLSVRWTASDLDGVQSVDLWLVRPGFSDSLTSIASGLANSGLFHWTVPSKPASEGYVRAVARDTSGNARVDQSDAPFEIKNGVLAVGSGVELQLALLPPTPNPAAGRLRLSFTLPVAASVKLIVLDVTGREVATVVDAWQPAGRHEIVWDRRSGRVSAAPGVYFARLQVGHDERVRKFILAQ